MTAVEYFVSGINNYGNVPAYLKQTKQRNPCELQVSSSNIRDPAFLRKWPCNFPIHLGLHSGCLL